MLIDLMLHCRQTDGQVQHLMRPLTMKFAKIPQILKLQSSGILKVVRLRHISFKFQQ